MALPTNRIRNIAWAMRILKTVYLAAILLLACGSVHASQCVSISAGPFVADKPGCYNFVSDIKSLGIGNNAITVKSDGVEIDLKGFKISGPFDPRSAGAGIYAARVRNLTIKGGTIEGFLYGIRVDGGSEGKSSKFVEISNMVVRGNYFRGISVEAENTTISSNLVEKTGGTELFVDAFAVAVEVKGSNCLILRNVVTGITPIGIGEGLGVSLSQNRQNCMVLQNSISAGPKSGASYGLWLSSEKAESFVMGNKISGFAYPFSVPQEGSRIWATIERNDIVGASCTPESFKSYYGPLPNSNVFISALPVCPYLISVISEFAKANPNDPRIIFRLAMAKFQCAAEPALINADCCNERRESLGLFQKASKMGLAEAARILPAVSASIEGDKGCKL